MSVLDRFEKSVEGAVNGVFAKFGSKDLQPVDLSSALEREIDKEAMPVTRDRTVAPNEYRFKLSTPDFNNIVEWGAEALANELADNLTQYAKDQHYAFVGPVVVIFEEDLDLTKSNFKLTSESVQGNTVPVTTDAQTEDGAMLEIGEGKDAQLTDGTSGYIVCFRGRTYKWEEGRDYLWPIPTDQRVATGGALSQNPGYEDGLSF